MKIRGIGHLAVAVRDLEGSLAKWAALLGAQSCGIEELPEMGVRLAQLRFSSGPTIELLAPCGENSPIEKFLAERGEGIHHFSLEVEALEKMMEEFHQAGLRLVSSSPRAGAGGSRVAFVHPRSLNGVLLELEEASR